ncbi:MAG: substrate-binding domain-containing protein, partial [Pseudomonadota bacterium]
MLAVPTARADVLVFAAASLKEPLDQIAAQFEGVVVSYGGSGTLARQASLGAPADIVLLAN